MASAIALAFVWSLYGHMLSFWIYRFDLMRDALGENDSPFLA